MPVQLRGTILTLPQRAKQVTPAIGDELREAVRDVVDRRRASWPTASGRSASQLDHVVRAPLEVAAVGRAPYTTAIVSGGRRPWDELVSDLERTVRELGPELGQAIDKALKA